MFIFDGIYTWEGWGGKLKLASGKCRMWIVDLNRLDDSRILHMKPFLVVVSDLPREGMSKREVTVRSACGHIATRLVDDYGIDPSRMLFVEYFPERTYGKNPPKTIPAVLDAVEFRWQERLALDPKRHPIEEPLRGLIRSLIETPTDAARS